MTLEELQDLVDRFDVVNFMNVTAASEQYQNDVLKQETGEPILAAMAKYHVEVREAVSHLEGLKKDLDRLDKLSQKVLAGALIRAGVDSIEVKCRHGRRKFVADVDTKIGLPKDEELNELKAWLRERGLLDELLKTSLNWPGMVELCTKLDADGEETPPHVKMYPGFKVAVRKLKGE